MVRSQGLMTNNAAMTISALAQAAGVGVETIRFYQRRGLLELPERSGGSGLSGGHPPL